VIYGIDTLFAGPYGTHYIRQTDSLSFIAYFREYSIDPLAPGVLDLRNAPDGGRCAGEFPLVYWCIGMIERFSGPLPLLLKWLDLLSVLVGHALLVRALCRVFNNELLAVGMGLLMFSSGVVAYYACNYLPDAFAYGLVLIGWSLVLPKLFAGEVVRNTWTTVAFVLAGLIKAPMAMHLLVWLIIPNIIQPYRCLDRTKDLFRSALLLSAVASWHFYARWYNAEHGSDYFLTSARPIWDLTMDEYRHVEDLVLRYWWTKYLHPTTWHVLALLVVVILARFQKFSSPVRSVLVLLILATAAFLVLFFRKLADHDYYFLTVMPAIFWLFTAGFWSLSQLIRKRWARIGITSLTWVLALSAAVLARTEVARRMSSGPDRFSGTAIATKGLTEVIETLDLPKDSRVIVIGDSTTNGALLSVGRLGWSFPGYPVTSVPDLVRLKEDGASHVLYLGMSRDGIPISEVDGAIAAGPTWSLHDLNR